MKYHCLKEWIRKDLISSSYITAIASSCISIFYFLSRRWVVVDNKDEHIRCYLHPVISQVTPHFEGDQLCLDAPGMETLKVNRRLNTNEYKDLRFVINSCTAKLSYNEPLYNEVLILTNNFLYPSNSKVYDFKRTLIQWNLNIAFTNFVSPLALC